MKKLSLILALAFLLVPSAFAQCKKIERKSDGIYCDGVKGKSVKASDVDCSKLEIKDDDNYYYEGKKLNPLSMYGLLCGSKIKGYDKAKLRQEHREREYQNKQKK